jgi:hypothetical protein|nr:hypothetical protein [Kofleriaceae bacterium]
MRHRAALCVVALAAVVAACGGSGNASNDAAIIDPDARACGVGDDCNISANTGCDDDDRCTLVQNGSGACFFPQCETDGNGILGSTCSVTAENEGAENWDNCQATLVCFRGTCTQACGHGGAACSGSAQCVQDPDVPTFELDICM